MSEKEKTPWYLVPIMGRWRDEKREWRKHVARVKALPSDYRKVLTLIEQYVWNFAADGQMVPVLDGILEMFEEGAADSRPVLDVTGDDVAAFAWNVLSEVQSKTWLGKKGVELNEKVARALNEDPADKKGTPNDQ